MKAKYRRFVSKHRTVGVRLIPTLCHEYNKKFVRTGESHSYDICDACHSQFVKPLLRELPRFDQKTYARIPCHKKRTLLNRCIFPLTVTCPTSCGLTYQDSISTSVCEILVRSTLNRRTNGDGRLSANVCFVPQIVPAVSQCAFLRRPGMEVSQTIRISFVCFVTPALYGPLF